MKKNDGISRRKWLKLGIAGAAGTVISTSCDTPTDNNSSAVATSDASCTVSPRQELGPFPPMNQLSQPDHDVDLTMVEGQSEQATGEVIIVKGKIMDLDCNPVAGANVIIWQSNHHGKYHHELDHSDYEVDPNFQGWGQAITNQNGEYQFKTIRPGLYTGRTRHIHYKVAAKGYHELITQLYFEGEEQNQTDSLLNQLPHKEQQRLICSFEEENGTPTTSFDIFLESVDSKSVSPEVLAEYSGTYQFDIADDHPIKDWFAELGVSTGTPIEATISSEGRRLFCQITTTPKAEILWKKKDTFDGIHHYSSEFQFVRADSGEVTSFNMVMNWSPTEQIVMSAVRS